MPNRPSKLPPKLLREFVSLVGECGNYSYLEIEPKFQCLKLPLLRLVRPVSERHFCRILEDLGHAGVPVNEILRLFRSTSKEIPSRNEVMVSIGLILSHWPSYLELVEVETNDLIKLSKLLDGLFEWRNTLDVNSALKQALFQPNRVGELTDEVLVAKTGPGLVALCGVLLDLFKSEGSLAVLETCEGKIENRLLSQYLRLVVENVIEKVVPLLALERQHDLLLFERLAITEQEYVDRQVIYLFSECLASGLGAAEYSSLVQVIAAGESKGLGN